MSGDSPLPQPFDDLIDAYADGEISEADLRRLEACLIESEEARRAFVEDFQLHTELHFAVRARRAADAAIERSVRRRPCSRHAARVKHRLDRDLGGPVRDGRLSDREHRSGLPDRLGGHCGIPRARASLPETWPMPCRRARVPGGNIAWLVNAQDCRWAEAESEMPGRDMKAGKQLRLLRGLAEIEFDRGARVILQGPADLELISGGEALLHHGTLTARGSGPGARLHRALAPR